MNAYGYVVEQFRRPYNHESTEPVTEADLKAAKQTMFDRIRAEAAWLCANATVRATAQQPVGFALTEIDERTAMQLAIDAGGKVIPAYGTRGDMVALYGDQLAKLVSLHTGAAVLEDRAVEIGESSDRKAAERKLTCEAIDGAMAFGYLNLNEPPAAHWLAPWWTAGQSQRAAMNSLRYLDRELSQYLEGMPADETSRKLRDAARDGLAGIDSSPLAATAAAALSCELETLIAVAAQHPLTSDEVSKAREVVRACAMLRGGSANGDAQTTTAGNINIDTAETGAV